MSRFTLLLGGDLIAWDLALRPCAVPRWGRVDLRTCASVGAGQLRGRGIGVVDPQQVAQPWVWAGADVGVAVALRRRDARPRERNLRRRMVRLRPDLPAAQPRHDLTLATSEADVLATAA